MKNSRIDLLVISIVLSLATIMPAEAQRKSRKVKAERVDPRIEAMIMSTQDVVIVDSIVVRKDDFLNYYILNDEAGQIQTFAQLYGNPAMWDYTVHTNGIGNRRYFAMNNSEGVPKLYTSDMIGGEWTHPNKMIEQFEETLDTLNYPFILSDGTTFYFAAKGKESIGGYDIFVTRCDPTSGELLKPENIGMPFNSTSNDYMMAIDEAYNIGWFASDRRQPQDSVCIYIFIPSESRKYYSQEEYSEEQIRHLASINSIADTWKDGAERQEVLTKLEDIKREKEERTSSKYDFIFIVNDNVTYTKWSDFLSESNAEEYRLLLNDKATLASLNAQMEKQRENYANVNIQRKVVLKQDLLEMEKKTIDLSHKINDREKTIRNAENSLIKERK